MTSAEELSAVSDRFNRRLSIGSTGGHCVSYQEFNGYFGLWVTGWTDATPARGIGSSDDTQIFCWPLEQRLQDLVAYIYASPRHLKIAGVPRHLIHIQEHLQAIQELIDHILSF